MARYRVKARSFINNQIVEPGAIVEFTGRPGKNLERIEAPAKVAPPAKDPAPAKVAPPAKDPAPAKVAPPAKDPAPAKDGDKPKEG